MEITKELTWTSKSTDTIFILKNSDISKVYIRIDNTGDDSKKYAVSNDPSVICEEYFRLTPDEVKELLGLARQT